VTPKESREEFIEGILPEDDLDLIRELGLYESYVEGEIPINTVYQRLRDDAQ